jgi:putative transcriptional regulator
MSFSFKPLWRILLEKDMTKEQLRTTLGFSTATIAKMGKNEYVSMETIDKICTHFGVQATAIMEHKSEG